MQQQQAFLFHNWLMMHVHTVKVFLFMIFVG